MLDPLNQIRYDTSPPHIKSNFCTPNKKFAPPPQFNLFLCLSQLIFFSQTDIKIVWVRNQYFYPKCFAMSMNDISNIQLYFTFNVMVCIVESTAFPTKT